MTDDRGESQRPSGPRPEGRWCSIELSCDRGQLPLVPHHRGRLTIHPSCMPRLTLADHLSRQTDRHESFDHARRIAARRCWTYRPRCAVAARRSESSAAATEKAATAHHRGRPRCSDKHAGHSGAMPAATVGRPRRSAACSGRPQRWGRGYGPLGRYTNAYRADNTCNVKSMLSGPPRPGPRHIVPHRCDGYGHTHGPWVHGTLVILGTRRVLWFRVG